MYNTEMITEDIARRFLIITVDIFKTIIKKRKLFFLNAGLQRNVVYRFC